MLLLNLMKRRAIASIKQIYVKKKCYYYSSNESGIEYEYRGHMIKRKSIIESLDKALRLCIIGSGPAGLYTADRLLKRFKSKVEIDILDRLSKPFGLVSTGVAPDHLETKNVKKSLNRVLEDPQCTFFGNVTLGKDITLKDIQKWYHGVILAYGSEGDKDLDIEGEDLGNVISARQFVWWYNGHPDLKGFKMDLKKIKKVLIIGMGNVALDCARILLKDPVLFEKTDMSREALEALKKSKVEMVTIVARRGPAQVKFTPKELKELLYLENVKVESIDLKLHPKDEESISNYRVKKRNLAILSRALESTRERIFREESLAKTLKFIFKRGIIKFEPKDILKNNVGSVMFEKMTMVDNLEESPKPPYQDKRICQGLGQYETEEYDLVIKSIGYKPVPIEGIEIDTTRNIIPNKEGRVLDIEMKNETSSIHDGLYVSGWLRRGPTGIIGTNLIDAEEVVDSIYYDCLKLTKREVEGQDRLRKYLHSKDINFVNYEGWQDEN